MLCPGNAGANTASDHINVLTSALDQVPGSSRAKILVRIDGTGATHDLLEHLEKLNTSRRTVRFTVGWKITDADEEAIAKIPESAWETAVDSSGDLQEGYEVAELTGLSTREGWPEPMRLIVRRVHLSRRHAKKLTAFEKLTGRRYAICATNIKRMHRVPGSHQAQFLDSLHRDHAEVEDRVRTNKAMGLTLHDEDELHNREHAFILHQIRAWLIPRRRFLRLERPGPGRRRSPSAGSADRADPDDHAPCPTNIRKERPRVSGSDPGAPRRHARAFPPDHTPRRDRSEEGISP